MRLLVRYDHKRRQRRSSGKQSLLYSQVLETESTGYHAGPCGQEAEDRSEEKALGHSAY